MNPEDKSTFSCGAYGVGTYNDQNCVTTTDTSQDNGMLASTGMPVVAFGAGGVLLIVIGVVVLVKMYRKKKKVS